MTILRNPHKVIHQPEYMMTISLQFHKLDSLQWPIAIVDYPARGQAPEIFAMRLNFSISEETLRTNYILIDYENIQPETLLGLEADHFKVVLFVGANQTKLPYELVSAMQNLGARAEYVKIGGNGSNALDFHIAFYIGHLTVQDPGGYFHIISKDTGFDPLIQHLKRKKVAVARSKTMEDILLLKTANSKSTPEKVAAVVADLKQRGTSKPNTVKTLSNTINSLFQKQLGEDELTSLLAELQTQGLIVLNKNKVSYALS